MTIKELRDNNDGKLPAYAWPGGYDIVYFSDEGYVYCPNCANQDDAEPKITTYDIYWEGPPMYCDGCNAEIESAYGDPEEEE